MFRMLEKHRLIEQMLADKRITDDEYDLLMLEDNELPEAKGGIYIIDLLKSDIA